MSFRNKSAFSDKYHNIFCEIMKSKSPDNAYWTKYIEKRDKLEKKYSGDLDLKTVQFKLEQQKLNYKKDFPFTQRSVTTEKALVSLKRSLGCSLLSNKDKSLQKNKNYYYKKDVLNLLSIPESDEFNYKNKQKKTIKGFDHNKYSNTFIKQIKKKFPDFVKEGYLQKTFCIDKSENLKLAKMKKEINKLFS